MDTKSRADCSELTAEQYLHDVLNWRHQQSRSSSLSLQKLSGSSVDAATDNKRQASYVCLFVKSSLASKFH